MIPAKGVSILAKNMSRPIVKENQYYIFVESINQDGFGKGIPIERVYIEINVQGYECFRDWVEIQSHEASGEKDTHVPMIPVRLLPDETYVLPKGYERVQKSTEPFGEIKEIKDRVVSYRLLTDYADGNIIEMLCEMRNIVGKRFRIIDEENGIEEDFEVIKKEDMCSWILERPLSHGYDKKKSKIYELYCVRADEKGEGCVIKKSII